MIIAPFLKLRDKITRKRQSLTQDEEKPFLSHLEDLRKTLTKIVFTLTISVVVCFMWSDFFMKVMKEPIRAAGLMEPRERNLPKAIVDMDLDGPEKQVKWFRIHGAARGMADLTGEQRDLFLKAAAPDEFTRQFAHAMLLYHAADALPPDQRAGFIEKAAAMVPGGNPAKITEYAAQLTEAETSVSLEPPHNVVETEALAPAEPFMLSMKLSLFAGIIVSFPLLFYFLLEFILPGLTPRERKMIFPALGIGFALFLAGVLFSYYVVIPKALDFFVSYGEEMNISSRWRISQYVSFVTSFCLIFGVAFELPVVVMVMVKLGLLTSTTMRRTRAWAIIIILVSSAVLTPTGDAFTMSLLGGPMIIMYEVCIWLAVLHERKERKLEEAERRRDEARRAALVGVASVQAARPGAEPEQAESTPGGEPDKQPESESAPAAESAPEPSEPESSTHPHHPDTNETEDDYEKYLRDQGGLTRQQTHTESVPVEEREAKESSEQDGGSSRPNTD